MPSQVLGKVSVTPRGDYNAGTTYYALDIVGYQGGSYLAMKEVTGVTPSNDGVNWMQLSGPGLPGEQGPQGNPGAAAGFGEATATVDDTSGTPSVEVETSGPDTAKVFTFKFYGLKGTKGDTGDKGNTGDTGPTGPQGVSVVTAQINEQGHLIITLSEGEPIDAGDATGPIGPQGIQGEAGESVGSIQRTSGTGAPGTTDTYTMYSTDGSEIGTFTVYNGTNGTGAGDFMADGSVPMTGALDMGGNKVTNLGAPGADTDAVRKSDLDAVAAEVDGILDGTTPAHLSPATDTKIGGVIIGEGLSVTKDGTLSADDQLPAGGTQGQVLTQGTTGPEWQDAPSGLPDGGAPGQVLTQGESGPEWTDAPDPLPTGGTDGQVLTKTTDGAAWENVPSELPAGGTTGQVLTKTADGSEWSNAPSGLPDGGTPGQMLYQGESGPEWGDKPVLYVNITESGGTFSADKTFDEILQAYNSGYLVIATYIVPQDNSSILLSLMFAAESAIYFSVYNLAGNRGGHLFIGFLADGTILNQEQFPIAKNVSFTPGTTGLTSDNIQGAIEEVNAKIPAKPKSVSVTLSASGWASNSQTVTVQGVVADETAQLIQPMPAIASQAAYMAAGIYCSGQAANSLTFTCQTAPTENITVYVVMQEVSAA